MIQKLILSFVLFLISLTTFAQTTPFCSDKDYLGYLKKTDKAAIHFVITKCSNVNLDLIEAGTNLANVVAYQGWQDTFDLIKNRKDITFQRMVTPLLYKKNYVWLEELFNLQKVKLDSHDMDSLAKLSPESLPLIKHYIEIGFLDPNYKFTNTTYIEFARDANEVELVDFLYTVSSIDLKPFWRTSCSKQGTSDIARKYFKLMLKAGNTNVNECGMESAFTLSLNVNRDPENALLILNHPTFEIKQPGQAYLMLQKLLESWKSFENVADARSIFKTLVSHKTFNLADKTSEGNSFLHLLGALEKWVPFQADFKMIADVLMKAPADYINAFNKQGLTPLMYTQVALSGVNGHVYQSAATLMAHPQFNPNVINANEQSPLLFFLANGNMLRVNELIKLGADPKKMGNVAKYSAQIADKLAWNFTNWLSFILSLDDFNLNVAFRGSNTLLSSLLAYNKDISPILDHPRFDPATVNTVQSSDVQCSALYQTIKGKYPFETIKRVLALSSEASQNDSCSEGNPLAFAIKLKDRPLIAYLMTHTKIPMGYSFLSALSKDLSLAEFILDQGYTTDINGGQYVPSFLHYAITAKDIRLIKKLLARTDVSVTTMNYYNSVMNTLAELNNPEIFELVMNHPSMDANIMLAQTYIGNYSDGLLSKNLLEIFRRFKLETEADQTLAHKTLQTLIWQNWPTEHALILMKKPKFNINFVYENYTVLTKTMGGRNLELFKEILKFPKVNPNLGTNAVIELLFGTTWGNTYDSNKIFLDLYYKIPGAKREMPASFFELVGSRRGQKVGSFVQLQTVLSSNFSFTSAQMKLFRAEFSYIWFDTPEQSYYDFIDAFLSHPNAKPIKQWSDFLTPSFVRNDKALTILKKHGTNLDLNIKVDETRSLITYALEARNLELFTYLVSVPAVNVQGLLPQTADDSRFAQALIQHRIKDISQVEAKAALVKVIPGWQYPPSHKEMEAFETVYKLVKNLDGLTAMTDSYREPLVTALTFEATEPLMLDFRKRLIKEDKFVGIKSWLPAFITAMEKNNQVVMDFIFTKGFSPSTQIRLSKTDSNGSSLIGLATHLKSRELIDYLLKKKAPIKGPYSESGWWMDFENPFAIAIKNDWDEGAEYLRTLGADLTMYRGSLLAYTLKNKDSETFAYLVSNGVNPNESDILVQIIRKQKDDLFGLVINHPKMDPNMWGTVDNKETFPLIEAVRMNRKDYVIELLKMPKIDKNIKDGHGYRAIEWAITLGYSDLVDLLK